MLIWTSLWVIVFFLVSTGIKSASFSERIGVNVLLVAFSALLGVAILNYILLDNCEHNLPRNQECKIIAVPKEVVEK